MTAFATIVLADGLVSPVNHNFSPTDIVGGKATYHDRISDYPIGYPELTIAVYRPTSAQLRAKGDRLDQANYKTVVQISVPVLDVTAPASGSGVQPAVSKAYSCDVQMTFTSPARSSLATRKDAFAYAKNLFAKTEFSNAVWLNEGVN